jgi:ribosomal protein L37E
MTRRRHPKGKGCWYFVTIYDCALCGAGEELRERRWTKKPKDPRKRYEYVQTACSDHFL